MNRREQKNAAVKAARLRHPERQRARNRVYRAVQSGQLVRPSACGRCGVTCKPEASHHDYAKPLDVEWLCRACHEQKDLADACPNHHPYAPDNTGRTSRGHRMCLTCRRAVKRRHAEKKRTHA